MYMYNVYCIKRAIRALAQEKARLCTRERTRGFYKYGKKLAGTMLLRIRNFQDSIGLLGRIFYFHFVLKILYVIIKLLKIARCETVFIKILQIAIILDNFLFQQNQNIFFSENKT